MIILDTNVVSEPTRASPSEVVRQWVLAQRQTDLFTTAITEAEIFGGIAALPAGKRRDALNEQARRIFEIDFSGKVLAFDSAAARNFSTVARRKLGSLVLDADAQIAAIAHAHGAVVATRNTKDFEGRGIQVVNPWNHSWKK
ncbi:MAG TPA: type II toxin-antitoxin system VapC family toxin [Rhizomicrobium sp.]